MEQPPPSRTELVVVGGGPGGYAAAFAAADAGRDVVLVSDEPVDGGACLHRGCIPSKSLLHLARVIADARLAAECGVGFGKPVVDLDRVREWKQSVIDRLASGLTQLEQARSLQRITARARFASSTSLAWSDPDGGSGTLEFDHAIVATGSSPNVPAALDVADPRIMDSTGALELDDIPSTLLVVGGGYIGLELGIVYAALGSAVTVVELTGGLLPGVDRDLVRPLGRNLETLLSEVRLNTAVAGLVPGADGVTAVLEDAEGTSEAVFDRVLLAVGRSPNTADLGLETTMATLDASGFLVIDDGCATTDSHILAIGDVAGEPMLAHKATAEARVAVATACGQQVEAGRSAVPAVVFTDPEVAWVGLTETEARASGVSFRIARCPWSASGRAHTFDRPDGLTKLLVDPDSEQLLGVGLVGVGAGELIGEASLALSAGLTVGDLARAIHPHPTLSETLQEAAEQYHGRAVHLPPLRRRE